MRTLRLLRHLRVLHIEPGDVLVYRLPSGVTYMSAEMRHELYQRLNQAFPNVQVVIIDSGDLGVIRDVDPASAG